MRTIVTVTHLQIQRGSLKRGDKPTRIYDPTPLLSVRALSVTPDGALGASPDGGETWIVDVHHRAHPSTKNEDGLHGISLGFTSHYTAMQKRFGDRLEVGCAGENIIAIVADLWQRSHVMSLVLASMPCRCRQAGQTAYVSGKIRPSRSITRGSHRTIVHRSGG